MKTVNCGALISATVNGPLPIGSLQRRLVECFRVDRVLRQDRHQADDQRQFAVHGVFEVKTDAALADALDPLDLAVSPFVVRPPLVAQDLERKDHIVDGHRLTVGKPGARD